MLVLENPQGYTAEELVAMGFSELFAQHVEHRFHPFGHPKRNLEGEGGY